MDTGFSELHAIEERLLELVGRGTYIVAFTTTKLNFRGTNDAVRGLAGMKLGVRFRNERIVILGTGPYVGDVLFL
jgi:hypothetical protein